MFYNPAMALSRDLHVAVVAEVGRRLGRPLTLWDALAATGVRGLRATVETGMVERLLGTDAHPEAVRVMAHNFAASAPHQTTARLGEARDLPPEGPFDLVDLDPYGTPRPFFETALSALRPGGVLGITATDLMVLAGPERATCERRYGGRPLRNYLCREAGLRILLACLAREAARRGRHMHPLVSYVRDHHARVYVRLDPAQGEDVLPVGAVPFDGYLGPPLRRGAKGGPLWLGPLHDPSFLSALRPPSEPARPGEFAPWLELLRGEARSDALFYYESGEVGKSLGLAEQPSLSTILQGLEASGWPSSRTAFDPSAWRTRAPWEEVARVVRQAALSPRTPGSGRSSAPP